MRALLRTWERVGGGSRDELLDGLRAEVLEDSLLALYPGFVHGAWSALSAGAILHDAASDAEWSFDRFYGFPERYFVRGSCKPGTSAAALFGLDETRVGELGQDASEQAAGMWASAEILSAVTRSLTWARYTRVLKAYRPSLLNSNFKPTDSFGRNT